VQGEKREKKLHPENTKAKGEFETVGSGTNPKKRDKKKVEKRRKKTTFIVNREERKGGSGGRGKIFFGSVFK